METISRPNRQFSLRSILLIMTGVAILCAVWSFTDRSMIEKARSDELHRAERRREHDRALEAWEKGRPDPCSRDFGF